MNNLGIIFALAGAIISALVAGIGSAKAVGMCGEAAAGVCSDDPSKDLSWQKGLLYFLGCLPMAIVGYLSAIKQGKAAISGISLVAKRPDQSSKAIIFAAMVETYAILALLVSILAVSGIGGLNI